MKRSIKSVTAFVLTLLLIIASPVAAFAATESGSIQGDSTVDTVIINVVLPTELDFALDPLGLDVTGDSQVATADYFFVNQTFAPVRVELEVNATMTNSAELVSTTSAITGQSDPTVTDKLIYFGALGATGISDVITATDAAIGTTDSAVSYPAYFGGATPPTGEYPTGSAVDTTLVPVDPSADGTTGSAVIGFALAAANESGTTAGAIESLADNNAGVAAFQFYAQLNTYAEWADGDISVDGAYTLVPLRTETYDTYHAAEVGWNQYIVTPPAPPAPTYASAGFIISEGVTATTHAAITSSKADATNITLPFYADGLTVTSLVLGGTYTIPGAEYAIEGDNFVIKKDTGTYTFRTASTGAKSMVLTLSDSSTYTFTINVTL